MKKFQSLYGLQCKPLGKDGRCVTACEEHTSLSRKAASEGMVLLKNENDVLPIKSRETVALFGRGTLQYVKGGGGSGDVFTNRYISLLDGMLTKEQEGKLTVYKPIIDFYKSVYTPVFPPFGEGFFPAPEPEVPEDVLNDAAENADIAIISLFRHSGEGYDKGEGKGGYYLSEGEEALVTKVSNAFKKVVIILNIGTVIDSSFYKFNPNIQSVLLSWQAGVLGGLATADILTGDVNPSGKLADTLAKDFCDYPSSATFHDSEDYIEYYEDIYVGYRYFLTVPGADKKINYPFGYGLSYTTFDIAGLHAFNDDKYITVTATVKNTGKVYGKEVVQIYYSAPSGLLGKPCKSLAAFKKTKLLAPGETQTVAIAFQIDSMASYDDTGKLAKSAYILEGGIYEIFVGNSSMNLTKLDYWYVVADDFRIVKQLTAKCVPNMLSKRMISDGTFEELPHQAHEIKMTENKSVCGTAPEETVTFDKVGTEISLEDFIAQLTDNEKIQLIAGTDNIGVSNTRCMGGINRLKIPFVPTADGPAGLRLYTSYWEIPTTAWPCATLLACTWNPDIMYEIGKAGALEVKENHLAIWLTPALNIHRTPLCGRNFEYFSEDPVLSGKMAASEVRGIQSQNISACIKHFCCNNCETNRYESDSRVSERALREIYLKGFEICVKESAPWFVMSSYNLVNGIHSAENYELLTDILRGEWGFDGAVTTDWGRRNNPPAEIKAGNDIKMSVGYPEDIKKGLEDGVITMADIEVCVKRILEMFLKLE